MSTPSNPLLLPETEDRLIADLNRLLLSQTHGALLLKNYLDLGHADACVDFEQVYRTSEELREVITEARARGVQIRLEAERLEIS